MICQKCNADLPATAPLPLCWGCTVGMAGRDELSQWLTALPQGGGTAMLGMPVQPMELAADGRTATASFIVAGELEGHYLYLPSEVAVASRALFDGKPVVWDHVVPTEDKEVGRVLNTWTTSDAVLGQYSVIREDHRKVLRAFKESGMGGMSARIRFEESNGFLTHINAVDSVDVVLTPASKTQILQASQQTAGAAGLPAAENWFAKARQFFSIPTLATRKEPETPQEVDMTEEERTALLEAVKVTIVEELKPHTAMLAEVQQQVSAVVQAQADGAAETTRKAAIRAKLAEGLPDANEEMLGKLVDLAYAQRVDGAEDDAVVAGVPAVVDTFKSIIAAMPSPEPEPAPDPTPEPEPAAIPVPQPTTLSAMMSLTPGATIPSGDEELAKFQAKFEASPDLDEHGRVKRPAPANGATQ